MCTSLLLTAGAPILLLFSEMGLAANNSLFIPTLDASGKVYHLDFYVAQSVNTKIAILTRAHRTDLSAALEFYIPK